MGFYSDLEEFIHLHRPHGRMTPAVGELTPTGYRVELACPCGVTFERWVLPQDAVEDLLTVALRRRPEESLDNT